MGTSYKVCVVMGIGRDSRHKKRKTGGVRPQCVKKRKHEMGRPGSNTKLGPARVRDVRGRGGVIKHRALRIESGNFSWGSENTTVQIDCTPFKQWYKQHYGKTLGLKKKAEAKEEAVSKYKAKLFEQRAADQILAQQMDDQFATGRLLASISSRPGQVGRADGYILEGKELEFYVKKLSVKKSKK